MPLILCCTESGYMVTYGATSLYSNWSESRHRSSDSNGSELWCRGSDSDGSESRGKSGSGLQWVIQTLCNKEKHQHEEPLVEEIGRKKARTYGFYHLKLCMMDRQSHPVQCI
jgi:hypothetical protein